MLKKGFTLVEIMVAVAIIAVLVGIAVVAGGSTRSAGRDNQRVSDIGLIRLKLEAYRDAKGIYPATLADLVSGGYLSVSPKDPSTKVDYYYSQLRFVSGDSSSCGVSYHLGANLETKSPALKQSAGGIGGLLTVCNGNDFTVTPDKTYDVISPDAFK